MQHVVQEGEADVVERAVLEHAADAPSSSGAEPSARGGGAFDMVAAADWPGLPEQLVLLSPSQCRTMWRQFSSDTSYAVQQVPSRNNLYSSFVCPRVCEENRIDSGQTASESRRPRRQH